MPFRRINHLSRVSILLFFLLLLRILLRATQPSLSMSVVVIAPIISIFCYSFFFLLSIFPCFLDFLSDLNLNAIKLARGKFSLLLLLCRKIKMLVALWISQNKTSSSHVNLPGLTVSLLWKSSVVLYIANKIAELSCLTPPQDDDASSFYIFALYQLDLPRIVNVTSHIFSFVRRIRYRQRGRESSGPRSWMIQCWPAVMLLIIFLFG